MLCIITAEKQCMSIKRHYRAFTDSNPITTSLFLTVNGHIRDSAVSGRLAPRKRTPAMRFCCGFVKAAVLDM